MYEVQQLPSYAPLEYFRGSELTPLFFCHLFMIFFLLGWGRGHTGFSLQIL